MSSTAMEKAPTVKSLRAYLETPTVLGILAKSMPAHLTPEKIVGQAVTLALRYPALVECTQESILIGIKQAGELGLELSGPLGQAYLVPRYNKRLRGQEATFQIGYRGLINLAFRSGKCGSFELRAAYKNEPFRVFAGTMSRIEHEPSLDPEGDPIAYYAVIRQPGYEGGKDFEIMGMAAMKKHRQRFAANNPIWDADFDAMALKTVARRLAKRVPLSVEFQQAAMLDEYNEAGVPDSPPPAPAPGSRSDEVAALLSGATPCDGEADPEKEPPLPAA